MDKNEKNMNLEELLKVIAASGAGIPIAGIRVMVEKAQDDGSQEAVGKESVSQDTANMGTASQKTVSKETTPATESKDLPSEPSNHVSIRIKNLHIHMDERMTTNYGPGALAGVSDEDSDQDACSQCASCDHGNEDGDAIDFDEMLRYIRRHTGLCEKVILTVLDAQINYLDTVFDEEGEA